MTSFTSKPLLQTLHKSLVCKRPLWQLTQRPKVFHYYMDHCPLPVDICRLDIFCTQFILVAIVVIETNKGYKSKETQRKRTGNKNLRSTANKPKPEVKILESWDFAKIFAQNFKVNWHFNNIKSVFFPSFLGFLQLVCLGLWRHFRSHLLPLKLRKWNGFGALHLHDYVNADYLQHLAIQIDVYKGAAAIIDQDIDRLTREISGRFIPKAADAAVRRKAMRSLYGVTGAAAISIGRILREYDRLYGITDLTYDRFLILTSNALYAAAYAGPNLLLVEDPRLQCGREDFERILSRNDLYFLSRMSETYSFISDLAGQPNDKLTTYTTPEVAKIKVKQLKILLKKALTCMRDRQTISGRNLFLAINGLTDAMIRRLDITETLLNHRSQLDDYLYRVLKPQSYRRPYWETP